MLHVFSCPLIRWLEVGIEMHHMWHEQISLICAALDLAYVYRTYVRASTIVR